MHITPIILSCWHYKQSISWAYLETAPRLALTEENIDGSPYGVPDVIARFPKGDNSLVCSMIGSEISPEDYDSIHNRVSNDLEERRHATVDGEQTNEIVGSPFKSNEIEHNGTKAWDALKARLAENGITIDDDRVAELAAGFRAEQKFQEILGLDDPQSMRDQVDMQWVRDIENRSDRDDIAQECLGELQANFPRSIACEEYQKAVTFDPQVINL